VAEMVVILNIISLIVCRINSLLCVSVRLIESWKWSPLYFIFGTNSKGMNMWS